MHGSRDILTVSLNRSCDRVIIRLVRERINAMLEYYSRQTYW